MILVRDLKRVGAHGLNICILLYDHFARHLWLFQQSSWNLFSAISGSFFFSLLVYFLLFAFILYLASQYLAAEDSFVGNITIFFWELNCILWIWCYVYMLLPLYCCHCSSVILMLVLNAVNILFYIVLQNFIEILNVKLGLEEAELITRILWKTQVGSKEHADQSALTLSYSFP